ncbi:hypothetical protein IFR05_003169 [Cadophora sp. M221]|nr:hypothetical protein IFR05_003169 [Cadophora sp. M221]
MNRTSSVEQGNHHEAARSPTFETLFKSIFNNWCVTRTPFMHDWGIGAFNVTTRSAEDVVRLLEKPIFPYLHEAFSTTHHWAAAQHQFNLTFSYDQNEIPSRLKCRNILNASPADKISAATSFSEHFHIFWIVASAAVTTTYAQTAGFATITVPALGQNVETPSLDIIWEPSTEYPGSISLTLLTGSTPSTLEIGATIATGISQSSGKYRWNISPDLAQLATYGILLSLDSDPNVFQYSFPFHIDVSKLWGASTVASTQLSTPTTSTLTWSVGAGVSVASTVSASSSTPASQTIITSSASTSPQGKSSSSTATFSPITTSPIESSISASGNLASQTSQRLPSETTKPKPGISTGAKAGISIGSALGFLILLGLVAFAFWFGRRSGSKSVVTGDDVMVGKSELEAGTVRASDLDSKYPNLAEKVNTHDEARAAELDGRPAVVAEIEGTYHAELDSGAK